MSSSAVMQLLGETRTIRALLEPTFTERRPACAKERWVTSHLLRTADATRLTSISDAGEIPKPAAQAELTLLHREHVSGRGLPSSASGRWS